MISVSLHQGEPKIIMTKIWDTINTTYLFKGVILASRDTFGTHHLRLVKIDFQAWLHIESKSVGWLEATQTRTIPHNGQRSISNTPYDQVNNDSREVEYDERHLQEILSNHVIGLF